MLNERIFISYGTADAEAHARWLHGDLQKRGFKTWFAEENIAPGTDWDAEIDRGLSSAKALVVVLTPGSVASPQVKGEWNYALNHYLPGQPPVTEPDGEPSASQFITAVRVAEDGQVLVVMPELAVGEAQGLAALAHRVRARAEERRARVVGSAVRDRVAHPLDPRGSNLSSLG